MKKFTLIITFLISILAPAHSFSFSINTQNVRLNADNAVSDQEEETEREIAIDAPGFDKKVTFIVLNTEISRFNIKIANSRGNTIVSSTLIPSGEGIVEMDLSDFEAGFYQITTQIGEETYQEKIVLP